MEILFGIGIFGFIIFTVIASFMHHSPSKREHVKALNEKLECQKAELKAIAIKMTVYLNKMLATGAISDEQYTFEIDKIIQLLRSSDIDYSFIFTIKRPTPYDKGQKLKEIMIIANALDDKGKMSKDEYERHINKALDELKKIK